MRLLRACSDRGSAPKPPGFIAFFPPEWSILFCLKGTGSTCPPAFPAAEPVARVASQHCPIPSGSGRLIINPAFARSTKKQRMASTPLTSCLTIGVHRNSLSANKPVPA
jgi:hypothetical protein